MLIEIIRQSLYTRDIQPTSKPLQICGHLRSCYAGSGCLLIFLSKITSYHSKSTAYRNLIAVGCFCVYAVEKVKGADTGWMQS